MQCSKTLVSRRCHGAARPAVLHPRRSPCNPSNGASQQRHTVARVVPELVPELVSSSPDPTTLAYTGIGLALASFLGTFVVIPRFKENFREGVDYKDLFAVLKKTGVRTLTPAEAYAKSRKGAILLDVRLEDKYTELHASLCRSTPLYRPIQGYDFASNLRRVGFAFFGIFGTELDPAFLDNVQAAVPKGKEIVVMCDMGGSLEGGNAFGRQSRSLKAYYYLQEAGYKPFHLKGGLAQWSRDGLPTVDADTEDEELPEGELASAGGGLGGWFSKLLQKD